MRSTCGLRIIGPRSRYAREPRRRVDIVNPFGPGHFLVGHGGPNTLVNGRMRTLDATVERFRPADPADYAIFGARLHAPFDGTVVTAEGDMPDFDVPQEDPVNCRGNHVILRCGDAGIVLAQMRQGSIAGAPGQTVTSGTLPARLATPALRPSRISLEAPIAGDPLALRIEGRFLVRGDRLRGWAR